MRRTRRPTFLHLRTARIMGHDGTDFEIEWRSIEELCAVEATDRCALRCDRARIRILMSKDEISRCTRTRGQMPRPRGRRPQAETVVARGNHGAARAVHADAVAKEAERFDTPTAHRGFGGEAKLPEKQAPKHLAIQINQALHDLFCKYPEALLFGEDVAQKGGVYTVTKGLHKAFGNKRVFNTLLDETIILGLAQGYGNMGMLPLPEIQYLAYFHNACDQIRGEAASLQFFSNGQYRNPMLMRIASLGYQRGSGPFHNDNSITRARIPGLVVGCPSRGDDAAMMLGTWAADDGRGRSAPSSNRCAVHGQDLHGPDGGG